MSEKTPQDTNYGYTAHPQVSAAGAPPARPTTIEAAFWMLVGAALLLIIRIPAGIAVLNSEEYQAELEAEFEASGYIVDVPATVASGTSFLVLAGIVSAAVLLLCAILSRIGQGWPRILLAVVTVLSLLNLRVLATDDVPVMAMVLLTAGSVLLTLVATVLLFLKPSSGFFKARKQHRQAKALNPA